jgi:HEAT repeats
LGDERPDALLKSALEKIVYFEARSQQLQNDLAAARAEAERLKQELAGAAQREIQLRRQVAELEVRATRSHQECQELGRVNEALRTERTALLGKVIEAARIHDADSTEEGADSRIDLARFISELRGEVLSRTATEAKKPAAPAPPAAPEPAPAKTPLPSPVTTHAARLQAEGRLSVSKDETLELSAQHHFAGRTEETLFGFSVRELSAPDPTARQRAAERLKALGSSAAAAPLATALHGESDPSVQVSLLSAFACLARAEGISVVQPLLASPAPDVRIAALKAVIALDPSQTGPQVAAAMEDPDVSVRRRAALLALGLRGSSALDLGEKTIGDRDSEVRRLAALVLGASHGDRARSLLLEALRDADLKVRQAAAQSLSRSLGRDLSSLVELDQAQLRREVRRLASLPASPQPSGTQSVATGGRRGAPGKAPPSSPERLPAPARASIPDPGPESLCGMMISEIRCSIRGRSVPELASVSQVPQEVVEQSCQLLVARGQAVRRGSKYFAA